MRIFVWVGLVVGISSGALFGQTFQSGQIYTLVQNSSAEQRLLHTDPSSWVTSDFVPSADVGNVSSHLAYDPCRDRLVMATAFPDDPGLRFVDAAGNTEFVPVPVIAPASRPMLIAPTGDGRIFGLSSDGRLYLIDPCDEAHLVHDVFGPGEYDFEPPLSSSGERGLLYDGDENVLYVCGKTPGAAEVMVSRVELNAVGTRVVAPVTSLTFNASGNPQAIRGFSNGPGSTVLGMIDANNDTNEPQFFVADFVAGAITTYASTNLTTLACGSYSSTLDLVVARNDFPPTNRTLRTFAAGDTGGGTLVESALPGLSQFMVVIGDTIANAPGALDPTADCDTNGVPDLCALASETAEDCDDNAVVDTCDIAAGDLLDDDADGLADACEPPEDFADGWMYTICLPGGTVVFPRMIQRVDPITRDVEDFVEVDDVDYTRITYDPYRQRLITQRPASSFVLVLIDSAGNVEEFQPAPWVSSIRAVAPKGDGHLLIAGANQQLAVLDPCDELRVLLNEAGTENYSFDLPHGYGHVLWHEPTHSLIVAGNQTSGPNSTIGVSRLPLDEDLTHVIESEIETVSYGTTPIDLTVVSLSAGPGDSIMIFGDTNGGAPQPQIALVHPQFMVVEPYATFNYSLLDSGTWNPVLGHALSNRSGSGDNRLMRHDLGDVDSGEQWTEGNRYAYGMVCVGASLVGVGESPVNTDCNGNGVRDFCDIQVGTSSDCNANGIPDECDIANGAVDSNGNGTIDECEPMFIRGDVNSDGAVQIADAVAVLAHLFQSGPIGCADAADFDDNDLLLLNDGILLLAFLFQSGVPPTAPFPACGVDATGIPVLGCGGPLPRCP